MIIPVVTFKVATLLVTLTVFNDTKIEKLDQQQRTFVRDGSVSLELLDSQYPIYFKDAAGVGEISSDIKTIRERYFKMRNFPSLNYLDEIFVNYEQVEILKSIGFCGEVERVINLKTTIFKTRKETYGEIRRQNQIYVQFWGKISDAKMSTATTSFKRESYKNACDLIGEEKFFNRDFPTMYLGEF